MAPTVTLHVAEIEASAVLFTVIVVVPFRVAIIFCRVL